MHIDTILDCSIEAPKKVKLFEDFCIDNNDDCAMEFLSRIYGIYAFTGLRIIREFLSTLVVSTIIPSVLCIEAANSLINYLESEDIIETWDTKEEIDIKRENNLEIQARNKEHIVYGYLILNNACKVHLTKLDNTYRFETIFTLAKSLDFFEDTLSYFYNFLDDYTIACSYRYKMILSLERKIELINKNEFISKGCLHLFYDIANDILYRLLAGQYLLTQFYKHDSDSDKCISDKIQACILSIADDVTLDINTRADAADILLSRGNEIYVASARDIINKLGTINRQPKTVYNNAQNVHVSKVEESTYKILNYLSAIETMTINDKIIDISDVFDGIRNILDKESKWYNKSLIEASLERIMYDRNTYTIFNYHLSDITIKLWSYIHESKYKTELIKSLLEELEDMSGTCSSGFSSRLANVISGFDDNMAVKISFEDQLVSNFVARMNYYTLSIPKTKSLFRERPNLDNMLKVFMEIKDVDLYLKENKDDIDKCLEDFQSLVINEMTISTDEPDKKFNFLLFFRTYFSHIRCELFEEFKEYMTSEEFDFAIRKAVSSYEGVSL